MLGHRYQYFQLRDFILSNTKLQEIYDLGDSIFPEVDLPVVILIGKKKQQKIRNSKFNFIQKSALTQKVNQTIIDQQNWMNDPEKLFTFTNSVDVEILNKIKENSDIKNLTGENSVILNAFLFANDPKNNISVVSLDDRYRVINFFNLGDAEKIRGYNYGEKIITTRNLIIEIKKIFGFDIDNRGLSCFL